MDRLASEPSRGTPCLSVMWTRFPVCSVSGGIALLAMVAGCTVVSPAPEAPPPAAPPPTAPSSASAPPAVEPQAAVGAATPDSPPAVITPEAPKPAPPKPATPRAATPQAAKPPPAASPAPVAAKAPALDLRSLEQRLKDTNAIGVMTKLSLKNQVDDLVAQFRAFHEGHRPPTLTELRRPFELLLMKVLSLLQDQDPALANQINASREAIWGLLTDRDKLAPYL